MWRIKTIKPANTSSQDWEGSEGEDQSTHFVKSVQFRRAQKGHVDNIKEHIRNLKHSKQSIQVIWNSKPSFQEDSNDQEELQPQIKFSRTIERWVTEDQNERFTPSFNKFRSRVIASEQKTKTSPMKTLYNPQPKPKGRSQNLSNYRYKPQHKARSKTTSSISPRSSGSHNRRFSKQSIEGPEVNSHAYNNGIKILQTLYESVSQMTFAIKNNPKQIAKLGKNYLDQLFGQGAKFIDGFLKSMDPRYKKVIVAGRIMEYSAFIYLMLQLTKNNVEESASNLINLVGHCASSVILLSRLFILQHKKSLSLFPQNSFEASISAFQLSTFKQELSSQSNVIRRIQHNNEIVTMLQNKIGRLNHRFSLSVKKLLKELEREETSTWLLAHHLFEYLAFYVHDVGLSGKIRYLDTAPYPYLLKPQNKKYTVVLQPHGVLFLFRQQKVTLRSFSRQFYEYLSKHFDLVIWTWLMPAQIDPVLKVLSPLVTPHSILYRYHCRQENEMYMKNLSNLGRDMERVLLIDFNHQIYRTTPCNGISMAWDGIEVDNKLLDLTQILLQMLTNDLTVADTLQLYFDQVQALQGPCKLHSLKQI